MRDAGASAARVLLLSNPGWLAISHIAPASAANAATIAAAIQRPRLRESCSVVLSGGLRLNGDRLCPATGRDFGFPLRRILAIDALPPWHAGA
jgi:hypothetical protein